MKRSSSTIVPVSSKKLVQSCGSIFQSYVIHILPACFGHGRLKVFKTQVENNGGVLCQSIDNKSLSHIIVEEGVSIEKILKLISKDVLNNVPVVKCTWLSNCLKHKRIVDVSEFIVSCPPTHQAATGTQLVQGTSNTIKIGSSTNLPEEKVEAESNESTVQEPLLHMNQKQCLLKDFSGEQKKSGDETIGKFQVS